MYRLIGLLIILLFQAFQAHSINKLEFERINSNSGLSSEEVRKIFQSKDGYMWFLTSNGLNRYDGYDIKTYKPGVDGLKFESTTFESICEDSEGNLWIGMAEKGLYIYDLSSHEVISFSDYTQGLKLQDFHIRSLMQDMEGNIWIGTEYGLYKYHFDKKELTYYNLGDLNSELPVWCIIESLFEDNEGKLWIGTWNYGLFIKEKGDDTLKNYYGFDRDQTTLNDNRIKSIFQDQENHMWIGTWDDGLYRVQIEEGDLSIIQCFLYQNEGASILGNIIYDINEDDQGRLWVGSPYGLNIIEDPSNEQPVIHSITYNFESDKGLSNNEVFNIYKDFSGLMWLGTLEGGVNKTHPNGKVFDGYHIPPVNTQIFSQTIQSFCHDPEGHLLLGIKSLGFGQYDLEKENYTPYDQLDAFKNLPGTINTVNCMLLKDSKQLWLGTRYSGLLVYDYETQDYDIVNQWTDDFNYESVNDLFLDQDQNIWVASVNGLFRVRRYETNEIQYEVKAIQELNGMVVNTIAQDKSGGLWIGTAENGIRHLNYPNEEEYDIEEYTYGNDRISSDLIQDIFCDAKGLIWVGTLDNGLSMLESSSESFKALNILQSSSGNAVYDICQDDLEHLWLTTDNGLTRILVLDDNFVSDRYSIADGLQGNIFVPGALYMDASGMIYCGGYYGFNRFSPINIQLNSYVPQTYITQISVNDEVLRLEDRHSPGIQLKHSQNEISFEFSAMSYNKPDKNRFAYRLENYQDDWQYINADNRKVVYSNLAPGDYVFYLKSANSSGLWNKEPVEVSFEILPAPYKTWWAYILYFLSFLSILVLVFRMLLKNERIERAYEIEKIEHAKSEKLMQFKLRFFTNISHELLTPLSVISCSLDVLKLKTRRNKDQYQIIDRNMTQLEKLLHQLLDFRKMESGHLKLMVSQGDANKFLKDSVLNFENLASRKQISLHISQEGTSGSCYFDADKLEKIMDNLLTNAIKYTQEGGAISIESKLSGAKDQFQLEIKVIDNGKGISEDDLKTIFERFHRSKKESNDTGTGIGLSFTKNLVELHKGTIDVESKANVGTVFTIKLPVHPSKFSSEEILDLEQNSIELKDERPMNDLEKPIVINSKKLKKSHLKILLVDDNLDFRTVLKSHFSENFEVFEADNGIDAFKQAFEIQPDIIVSDIMMPKKDGIELCIDLKNNIDTKYIPIILITAKKGEEERLRGYKAGAESYISKPISLPVLESRINALLIKRHDLKPNKLNHHSVFENERIPDPIFIQEIENYIHKNLSSLDLSVKNMAQHFAMSESVLFRRIKKISSLSPIEYIKKERLNEAALLLKTDRYNISEVAYNTGFSSQSYFSACFKKQFNQTPGQYLKKQIEMDS